METKNIPAVISLSEAMNDPEYQERFKTQQNIYWEYDNKFLTAYKNKNCKKTHYYYYIDKKDCKTREQRFDWLCHMSSKVWIDIYKFNKIFLKALKHWNL